RASLSNSEMLDVIKSCGAVICAAGAGLAPADKKLYALRDVTGTVQAIPLIASSIMSKKIAEGTSALVLDVKTGSGAFMSDPKKAGELARVMVELGKRAGVKTRALVTAMDVPLGLTAGNALEVRESIEVLAGGGPSDVVELTLVLAREMLDAAGIKQLMDPADALKNGAAMDSWKAMIRAQGGDPDAKLPQARENILVTAESDGMLSSMDAMSVGIAAWRLGAGRSKQGEKVSFGAGIEIHAKPGAQVKKGDPIYTLHADEPERFARALSALENSFGISQDGSVAERLPLIIEKIEG
nr:thymidine phosphorylase [Actinomycetota bacterium]